MSELICQFCQRKTRPTEKPETGRYYVPGTKFWQCDYHAGVPVIYIDLSRVVQSNNSSAHHIILVWLHKDETYYATFFYLGPSMPGHSFEVTKKVAKNQISAPPIIKLDFYPDITPENIGQKLKLYMIFS